MIDLISGCGSLVLGDNNTRIRVLLIFFILPVYMTLLMTAWCKSKFTMLCKHVIVYCG